jgi:hypothetical protein
MNVFEGAALREEIVLSVVDELAQRGVRRARFHAFGPARIGVLRAAHELAKAYPQFSERIYQYFGMEGWTKSKEHDKSVEKLGPEKI